MSAVDDSVGRIIEWLDGNGAVDNTVVIYTSDNGFYFGEHGLIDKRSAYEESIRVPMIVSAPGRFPGDTTVSAQVANLDIAPTILDLAGADVPEQFEGQSFRGLLDGSRIRRTGARPCSTSISGSSTSPTRPPPSPSGPTTTS